VLSLVALLFSTMFSPIVSGIVKQELEKEAQELEKKIADMEMELEKASESETDEVVTAQWTNSYKQWEKYQDTDELATKIRSTENDLAKLKERITRLNNSNDSLKTCSHRFACGCSGNKQAEREVAAMNTSRRLQEMQSFKEKGNIFFGKKKYTDALALYEKSLIYFEYCFDGSESERRRADDLRLCCLVNAGE
jgi:hypothetical protein